MRQTDGQFVNSCSDALNRPTPDRVRELVVAWGKLYPQFGAVGALDLVKCLNWPSGSAPQDPKNLKIPVMLLGVQNDPIVGNDGWRPSPRPSSTPAAPASGRCGRASATAPPSTRRARCHRSSPTWTAATLPATDTFCPA